jgi:hypothetical protein
MVGLNAAAAAAEVTAGVAFIDVRYAPVATKFRFVPKCCDGLKTGRLGLFF